ncbi:MAG: sugar transferase [Desulfobulbaceae bacterium]|nr:sugar transferase [Desulfobulbaceae bacterium]
MIEQQVYILNNILMLLDALCVIVAGYAAFYVEYARSGGSWVPGDYLFAAMLLGVVFVNNYVLGRFNLYGEQRSTHYGQLLWALVRSVIFSFGCLVLTLYLYGQYAVPRDFVILFALLSLLFLALARWVAQLYIDTVARQRFNARKILVVGDIERGRVVAELLARQLSWGHEVIGILSETLDQPPQGTECLGTLQDLPRILQQLPVDEVVFTATGSRSVDISTYLNVCRKMGIPSRILPALWQPGDTFLSVERCQGVPFLTVAADNFNATGLLYKRILDFAGGLVGTAIFFFLYPLVGLAIKLDSPGPVLFRQKRVGRHGRVFELLKFRTMCSDAEARKEELLAQNEMQGAMFKVRNDPRITPLGRWLRKSSLDEFPQFWNVLKGEMSLVGTRPPTLDEVKQYEPWQRRRISAKPGITGLWQVSGRNRINDFNQVVELDCQYLDQWRFSDDLWILLKTVVVVFQRKGAS